MWRAAFYASRLGLLALVYGCSDTGSGERIASPPEEGAPAVVAQLTANSLDVEPRTQKASKWCWAASGEMVMDFLGKDLGIDVNQCSQADLHFDRHDCCSETIPSGCDNGGWPKFHENGFDSKRKTKTALSMSDLRQQIDAGRPVGVSWEETGGGGHMVTVIGYVTTNGVDNVEIIDPFSADYFLITYEAYVDGQGYTHWDDFYDITKR
jgi:hypothetical protein